MVLGNPYDPRDQDLRVENHWLVLSRSGASQHRPHRGIQEGPWGAGWLNLAQTYGLGPNSTLTFLLKITFKKLNTHKDSIAGLKKTPLHIPLLKVQNICDPCPNPD